MAPMQRGKREYKMRIFETERSLPKKKFNQVVLDPEVSNYAALYALSRGRSKGAVFREIIDDWYREQRKKIGEDALINRIVTIAENRWSAAMTQEKYGNFEAFLAQMQKELEKKKLEHSVIKILIKKLHGKNQERINKQSGEEQSYRR